MSRRAGDWHPPASTIGIVYLLHLDPPLKHAKHYWGFHREAEAWFEAKVKEIRKERRVTHGC